MPDLYGQQGDLDIGDGMGAAGPIVVCVHTWPICSSYIH